MKKRILALPLLLSLAACRHLPARAPTQEEIQRDAPAGGLVRVTLRDSKQPYRFSSYLVDVRNNKVVDKVDGSKREELEGLCSESQQSAPAGTPTFLMSSAEVYTDCKNPETQPGCIPGALNGDPGGPSGGGGDPTGHEPLPQILRLAALSFWSVQKAGLPISQKPMTLPNPTHGR